MRKGDLRDPRAYAEGLSSAADLPQITRGLLERGYSEENIRKIMGENFLRALYAVWRK